MDWCSSANGFSRLAMGLQAGLREFTRSSAVVSLGMAVIASSGCSLPSGPSGRPLESVPLIETADDFGYNPATKCSPQGICIYEDVAMWRRYLGLDSQASSAAEVAYALSLQHPCNRPGQPCEDSAGRPSFPPPFGDCSQTTQSPAPESVWIGDDRTGELPGVQMRAAPYTDMPLEIYKSLSGTYTAPDGLRAIARGRASVFGVDKEPVIALVDGFDPLSQDSNTDHAVLVTGMDLDAEDIPTKIEVVNPDFYPFPGYSTYHSDNPTAATPVYYSEDVPSGAFSTWVVNKGAGIPGQVSFYFSIYPDTSSLPGAVDDAYSALFDSSEEFIF